MEKPRRFIRIGVGGTFVLAGLGLALIPQRCVPTALTSYIGAQGRFEGEPIRATVPRGGAPTVPIFLQLNMETGVCRVHLDDEEGPREWFSAQRITQRGKLPAGSRLVLDPMGNAGSYRLSIGPPWQWLGPNIRHFVLLPMFLVMAVSAISGHRKRTLLARLDRKRLLYLAGLTAISGVILYPAVHESGHLLAGAALGGVVDWGGVAWTALSGETPHASFSHLPDAARPWMSAGGTVLPILVGLLLLVTRQLICRKASWYSSAALTTVAALFLFSAAGCLFELHRDTHMDMLAVHLGLTGLPRVLFSLSPLAVALLAGTAVLPQLRGLGASLRRERPAPGEKPTRQR